MYKYISVAYIVTLGSWPSTVVIAVLRGHVGIRSESPPRTLSVSLALGRATRFSRGQALRFRFRFVLGTKPKPGGGKGKATALWYGSILFQYIPLDGETGGGSLRGGGVGAGGGK